MWGKIKRLIKYINSKRQCRNNTGPLQNDSGHLTNSDIDKAEVFNAFFASVFNMTSLLCGDSDRTQGSSLKLCQGGFGLDIRIRFITKLVGHWNRLPRKLLTAPAWQNSGSLDNALSLVMWLLGMELCRARSWIWWPLWIPSNSAYTVILWSCWLLYFS